MSLNLNNLPFDLQILERAKKLINSNDVLVYSQQKLLLDAKNNAYTFNFLKKLDIEYYPIYGNDIFQERRHQYNSDHTIMVATLPNKFKVAILNIPGSFSPYKWFIFNKANALQIIREIMKLARFEKEAFDEDVSKPILSDELYKSAFQETIGYLELFKKHRHLNLKARRGVIFAGKPGNGKTMFCRHLSRLAEQNNYDIAEYTGSCIVEAYTKGTLTKLMSTRNIIIFDDVDMGFFSRTSQHSNIANGILSAMDGLSEFNEPAVRIFCTNEKPENMDSAFLRPGRIDNIFEFKLPCAELKSKYIDTWIDESFKIFSKEEIKNHASEYPFSFAELAEVKNKLIVSHLTNCNVNLEDLLPRNINQSTKHKIGF